MMLVLRLTCLVTLLIALKCQKVPVDKDDGSDSSRIVNGSRARPGQFPFVVSLQLKALALLHLHTCTLSLITTKTCLGAAHCAVNEDDSKMSAKQFCGIVGSIIQSKNSPCHQYSDIVIHDKYDSMKVINDIALFIFEEEIKLDKKFVDTIPLIASTEFSSETVTAIGWGNLHTLRDEDSPKILRFVKLKLLPLESCEETGSHICLETDGKGVCAGDSGGPNVISVPGKHIQVGVSSYVNYECANDYSVATAVGAFTEWIKKNSVGEPTFVNEKENSAKIFI